MFELAVAVATTPSLNSEVFDCVVAAPVIVLRVRQLGEGKAQLLGTALEPTAHEACVHQERKFRLLAFIEFSLHAAHNPHKVSVTHSGCTKVAVARCSVAFDEANSSISAVEAC
jgi:hypothetical protein